MQAARRQKAGVGASHRGETAGSRIGKVVHGPRCTASRDEACLEEYDGYHRLGRIKHLVERKVRGLTTTLETAIQGKLHNAGRCQDTI